jgi:hypothetical protein
MNLPAIITCPIVVLSYGRSGSMLLAHSIGQLCKADPVTIQVATLDHMLSIIPNKTPIHTHLRASKSVFKNYTQIYNLRYDPVETVLSAMLAYTFDHYHQFVDNALINHSSFEFVNWDWLGNACDQFIKWHNHYGAQLSSDDYVVVYEKYVDVICNRPNAYQKVYPNKEVLLSNYAHIREFIVDGYFDSMFASIQPFLQHQNPVDIYQAF